MAPASASRLGLEKIETPGRSPFSGFGATEESSARQRALSSNRLWLRTNSSSSFGCRILPPPEPTNFAAEISRTCQPWAASPSLEKVARERLPRRQLRRTSPRNAPPSSARLSSYLVKERLVLSIHDVLVLISMPPRRSRKLHRYELPLIWFCQNGRNGIRSTLCLAASPGHGSSNR